MLTTAPAPVRGYTAAMRVLLLLAVVVSLPACRPQSADSAATTPTDTSGTGDSDDTNDTVDTGTAEDTADTVDTGTAVDTADTATGDDTADTGGGMDPALVVDKTYLLDLSAGDVTEPAAVGSLLAAYLGNVLLGVPAADVGNIDLRIALPLEGSVPAEQDPEVNSVELPGADFGGAPGFELLGASASITASGTTIEATDVQVSGAFSADASRIDDLRLAGLLDTRGLAPLISEAASEDEMCVLAAGLGVACTACPDGVDLCIEVVIERVPATEVAGLELVEVNGKESGSLGCTVATGATWLAGLALLLVARRQRN